MSTHVDILVRDIDAAKALYAPTSTWSAESIGYFMHAVLQGAFILAKAKQTASVAHESLAHLRQYLEVLFPLSPPSSGVAP
jgi:TetR/AcrR family transcriptional regulator, transcriptional repressor for nem operon